MTIAARFLFTVLWLGASLGAMAADDPVAGRTLFDNTPSSGGTGIIKSCPQCHVSVENRRTKISGVDQYADISFDMALARFRDYALVNVADMAQFRALTTQQVRDISAYLADTPKTSPTSESQLTFTAALNGNSAAQTVTITHALATAENLQIDSVAAIGTGQANFVVQGVCNSVTLMPGQSCTLTVTYAPTNSTVSTPDLVFTLKQGASTNPTFERVLFLSGSVTGTPPAGTDSGGGALGLTWLAALGLAVGLLARRRA